MGTEGVEIPFTAPHNSGVMLLSELSSVNATSSPSCDSDTSTTSSKSTVPFPSPSMSASPSRRTTLSSTTSPSVQRSRPVSAVQAFLRFDPDLAHVSLGKTNSTGSSAPSRENSPSRPLLKPESSTSAASTYSPPDDHPHIHSHVMPGTIPLGERVGQIQGEIASCDAAECIACGSGPGAPVTQVIGFAGDSPKFGPSATLFGEEHFEDELLPISSNSTAPQASITSSGLPTANGGSPGSEPVSARSISSVGSGRSTSGTDPTSMRKEVHNCLTNTQSECTCLLSDTPPLFTDSFAATTAFPQNSSGLPPLPPASTQHHPIRESFGIIRSMSATRVASQKGRPGTAPSNSTSTETVETNSPPKEVSAEFGCDDIWDWPAWMAAYAAGRFDPFKIPNPPRSRLPALQSSVVPSTPGYFVTSTSEPSSIVSPSASQVQISERYILSGPASSQPRRQSTSMLNGNSILYTSDLPPPPLHHSNSDGSVPGQNPKPASSLQTRRPPLTSEFAASIKLASGSANLGPFTLDSPTKEDPPRTMVSNPIAPRKVKSSSMKSTIGSSWTVSNSGLSIIPGTPSGVSDLYHPIASAPLERSGDSSATNLKGDYFGGFLSAGSGTPMNGLTSQASRHDLELAQNGSALSSEETTPIDPSRPSTQANTPMSSYEQQYLELGFLVAPKPPDEDLRRKALHRYQALGTDNDINFDRIAHLAKLVFNTKMVLIALIDESDVWHKSAFGINGAHIDHSVRSVSFCQHAILQRSEEPIVVLDASKDWRFMGSPTVTGFPFVRFYAGAPLRTPDGYNIGSLCVFDDRERTEFSPRQRHALKEFAQIAMRELELWKDKVHVRRRDAIQGSLEKFTRECVEMDSGDDAKMKKIYEEAAHIVKKSLDVEGSMILDLTSFEAFQGSNGVSYRAENGYSFGPMAEDQHPIFTAQSSSICTIPILSVCESNPVTDRSIRPIQTNEHQQIAEFLKSYPEGRIFSGSIPPWFRQYAPPGFRSTALLVPIFDIDQNPFLLICAYTSQNSLTTKDLLEGYELTYLRATGLTILSTVLKKRMNMADKAKSNFISNISHELRTPLHGILVAGELLEDTLLTEHQTSYLQTIQACGNSLIETVNHVLDFSKLSSTQRSKPLSENAAMVLTDVDLLSLCESVVENCFIGQRSEGHEDSIGSYYAPVTSNSSNKDSPSQHIECVIDLSLRSQGWMVKCEKAGIRRVLMNLVGNALKFTKTGFVHVTLRELPSTDDSSMVPIEIAVIDTGKGISKEFLKDGMFHPFSQQDHSAPGTGLGLAITQQIVASESVQGKLDVYSAENRGTEIKVTFNAEASILQPTRSFRLEQSLESLGKGLVIALVGFEESDRGLKLMRDVLSSYAEAWGFTVVFDEVSNPDVMVLNGAYSMIHGLSIPGLEQRQPPLVLCCSSRESSYPALTKLAQEYEEAGGRCHFADKPVGPIKFEKALRSCVSDLNVDKSGTSNGTNSVARSSSGGVTGVSTGISPSSPRNPSTSAHLQFSDSFHLSSTGVRNSLIGLQRRRSEEERRLPKTRPSLSAARSITYHGASTKSVPSPPSTASKTSQISALETVEDDSPSPVVSKSTLLLDGGLLLKAAVRPASSERQMIPRILVCEDNSINRKVLGAFLKKKGYEYKEAVNGQQGIDLFKSHPANYFDLCLMDISMPIMSGIDATKGIREIETSRQTESESHRRLSIFALTGASADDDKKRAFTAGVDGYLVKPISLKTLQAVFDKLGFA